LRGLDGEERRGLESSIPELDCGMTDFLLELRSEEIPARMQVKAKDDLARLFAEEIAKAGLTATAIETFATPRRLALIARGLPCETAAVSEERKGPRSNAPEQALAGFLRSTGLTREQLVERDGVFFAVMDKPGRATADVLADAIPAVVRAFPWPKSMRWGDASISTESLRWVRPLQGIVALLGETIVPFEIDGIESGATTMGHRFHHSGPVTIESADTYVEQLRAAHVIVHLSERINMIREGAARAAGIAEVIPDEGLVLENAGLTELPVPLLGKFDSAFLDLPPEVIQLTMRVNQKYFACRGEDGRLWSRFVCVANIESSNPEAIIAGNERVLSARLSDAKFFWENDLKVPLEAQREKLSQIVFHEKLGTVADKVERVAKLARWLVESGVISPSPLRGVSGRSSPGRTEDSRGLSSPETGDTREARPGEGSAVEPSPATAPHPPALTREAPLPAGEREKLATLAETAARLCKADLVTGMVGEFPELQGIIGGHLARAQGLPDAVADAIRDHYKPVGQGDEVPTAPVTVAVSLADKLDTICSFFDIDERPTGSKDPFALRRSALGIIALAKANDLRMSLFMASYWALLRDQPNVAVRAKQDQRAAVMTALMETLSPLRTIEALKAVLPLWSEESGGLESEIKAEVGKTTLAVLPVAAEVRDFLIDRVEVAERDNGIRPDIVRASKWIDDGKEDDLVRLLARVKALQAFVGTTEGANLLAGYKRASNILKKEGVGSTSSRHAELDPGSTPPLEKASQAEEWTPDQVRGDAVQAEESALIAALDTAEPLAAVAIDAEDFAAAMSALATLRTPIDAFFENVTVNDPDPAKRTARLALLTRFRDAVHRVADFSKIEG
jgi:glycyl-tRNA synthetase beta chain